MIRSMTAYGASRLETPEGTLRVEIRGLNNRYLDLTLRVPDELRFAEPRLRELIGHAVRRGKLEVRVAFSRAVTDAALRVDEAAVRAFARQWAHLRAILPELQAPTVSELLRVGDVHDELDVEAWLPHCERACQDALQDFNAGRAREGARLAHAMLALADEAMALVDAVAPRLPELTRAFQASVATRLRDALEAACPEGLHAISGEELSARIAQEASLFGLRVDVAEELTRLRAHGDELRHLLRAENPAGARGQGKRLDFLFQEMNREANTLGSKAAGLAVTSTAIELKLLIEQLREQAQNIE